LGPGLIELTITGVARQINVLTSNDDATDADIRTCDRLQALCLLLPPDDLIDATVLTAIFIYDLGIEIDDINVQLMRRAIHKAQRVLAGIVTPLVAATGVNLSEFGFSDLAKFVDSRRPQLGETLT
jgi:hypothetical protein